MNHRILTVVSATVDPSQEAELLAGFQSLLADQMPDGLIRTELLETQPESGGSKTLWRDRATLDKMRVASEPAAPRLFRSVGAEPTLQIFEVMVEHILPQE